MYTKIKFCGITNIADAQAAVEAGADALGFIGVPTSPRYVTPETVEAIRRDLPPFVTTVAVVLNLCDGSLYATDRVQYYEDGDGKTPEKGANRRIRVFRIKDGDSLKEIRNYGSRAGAYLIDTYHENMLGGSGKSFDWELAIEAKRLAGGIPIILAGGLTPENVADAVATVQPYAVDVSSGVEKSPGIKDTAKMAAFVAAVRKKS